MKTLFVGSKDFRQNMAKYAQKAKKMNVKLIILKKNVPILEVAPIDEKEYQYIKISEQLQAAEQQIQKGEYATQEEVMKEFGLL